MKKELSHWGETDDCPGLGGQLLIVLQQCYRYLVCGCFPSSCLEERAYSRVFCPVFVSADPSSIHRYIEQGGLVLADDSNKLLDKPRPRDYVNAGSSTAIRRQEESLEAEAIQRCQVMLRNLYYYRGLQETFTHSTLLAGSPSVVLVQVTTLANAGRTPTPTPCPS